ncbi:endopeptidase La [Syntrophobacter fumaroxidans]|uniref:Lon protease 1 n=1 Tax=Syntrophobacter fumaroxidans (strain DSM 10017 / MPOB) TaxID=335543 RepID=LON1_SYNFM|nr:endopeptidase La [Syntrophobacter fumaroxidans]A0LEE9.1 RecName: Full=Lon protease 1; AltName: Full=ATP-dependent protease La 1 [Syntrophobacter fumaroxidans MPOB]ABK15801.1 Lon-A peptidase. Serine peptidase. MEROPS family S16 [Syntrophobacter fumaroxidans MPOB]
MFKLTRNKDEQSGSATFAMPLLPLRDIVVFPSMVVPLFVGRDKSVNALDKAMATDKKIFLAAQTKAKTDTPGESDIYRVGTVANILQILRLPDGTVKVLVEGDFRARISSFIPHPDHFFVSLEGLEESEDESVEIEALRRGVRAAFDAYSKHNKKINQEILDAVAAIDNASRLADTIAAYMPFKLDVKQKLLETLGVAKRLEKLFGQIRSEIEILQTEERIKGRVKKQMEKTQREYYLNEQMRAIQKEMGEKDDFKSELEELEKRIKRKKLSQEAAAKVRAEFKKLKLMSPMSAEATVVRNYIDWILSLPWYEKTRDKLDIDESIRILDEDHYGLEKPKERIIEYLAVQALVKRIKGPILCFVGPPGVGKTSLAKSIARAMNRNFIRLSLGGVRDEAEIRGHRRTYIGAMPGKIIQSLKKVKSNNPVFCLDEVDKMSMDFRGDPSAALLEVLDPEQNFSFNDHYLDLDYDLSEVFFITTANNLHSIPPPLRDRMEIIQIAGYTEFDKLNIGRNFLVAKQCKANGLSLDNIAFSDDMLLYIIRHYTKEAGVRNLEREIASICRKVAKEVVRRGPETRIELTEDLVQEYLGIPKFRYGVAEEKDEIGLAVGLAWTEFGGDILGIETVVMPGKGKVQITGKLGDVMQESAQAALSYVRSRAKRLGIDPDFYQNFDIHVHVPEGAIPKDGPSAGITMATSIVSALARIPVRSDLAMTGEITLRGRVLPIGGLKEKILAAHRALLKTVLIPKDNAKDLKDIPAKILEEIQVELVEHMDDVLRKAMVVPEDRELFHEEEAGAQQAVMFEQKPPAADEIRAH